MHTFLELVHGNPCLLGGISFNELGSERRGQEENPECIFGQKFIEKCVMAPEISHFFKNLFTV